MFSILNLSEEERRTLFRNTAQKMGVHEAIIEKDFWVCFVLEYLFHQSRFKNHLIFKGGTSLSKCFGLIRRFSEDIDLILDWRILGYEKSEPWAERSKTKIEPREVFRLDRKPVETPAVRKIVSGKPFYKRLLVNCLYHIVIIGKHLVERLAGRRAQHVVKTGIVNAVKRIHKTVVDIFKIAQKSNRS
jgi:hypothetical protein